MLITDDSVRLVRNMLSVCLPYIKAELKSRVRQLHVSMNQIVKCQSSTDKGKHYRKARITLRRKERDRIKHLEQLIEVLEKETWNQ